jgi:hypothetical protein
MEVKEEGTGKRRRKIERKKVVRLEGKEGVLNDTDSIQQS